ncbi:alpha-ketoglutarate-dependent dioxygenase AlkB family protein [Flexithrix dorotheae]|uniref:alpha-ketoglutarate-dependent dioxygenase AlkB family protein n=1 Tax=Flexithrix dorotheae TaxID=70993 RepID=UPI000364356B|nr:alpha-ketoglutarate-dependent dioxygenase AlkB [Flexithrix dorotheae]
MADPLQSISSAEIYYHPNFYEKEGAANILSQLQKEIVWEQKEIQLFGKTFNQPRLTAFYGENGISYTYSKLTWKAIEWHPVLQGIKQKIEMEYHEQFNCVLLNFYRNGNDSMSWHSDDEPELGKNPVIASMSFGAKRKFQLRKKENKKEKYDLELENGSLLLMKGKTQHLWQHQLPKSKKETGVRINLTFRKVIPQ